MRSIWKSCSRPGLPNLPRAHRHPFALILHAKANPGGSRNGHGVPRRLSFPPSLYVRWRVCVDPEHPPSFEHALSPKHRSPFLPLCDSNDCTILPLFTSSAPGGRRVNFSLYYSPRHSNFRSTLCLIRLSRSPTSISNRQWKLLWLNNPTICTRFPEDVTLPRSILPHKGECSLRETMRRKFRKRFAATLEGCPHAYFPL